MVHISAKDLKHLEDSRRESLKRNKSKDSNSLNKDLLNEEKVESIINSINKESIEDFLPTARLFISVDLNNSTALKFSAKDFSEDDEVGELNKTSWFQNIITFFIDFNNTFRTVLKDFKKNLPDKARKAEVNALPIPSVWKLNGDEILYVVTIKTEFEALNVIDCLSRAINIQQHKMKQNNIKKDSLDDGYLKATAWYAIFPQLNEELYISSNMEKSLLTFVNYYSTDISKKKSDMLKRNEIKVDYIGPMIDAGFRLTSFSSTRKLVLSIELTAILASAIYDSFNEKHANYNQALNLKYGGSHELKGVVRSDIYPVFWVDNFYDRSIVVDEKNQYLKEEYNQLLDKFENQSEPEIHTVKQFTKLFFKLNRINFPAPYLQKSKKFNVMPKILAKRLAENRKNNAKNISATQKLIKNLLASKSEDELIYNNIIEKNLPQIASKNYKVKKSELYNNNENYKEFISKCQQITRNNLREYKFNLLLNTNASLVESNNLLPKAKLIYDGNKQKDFSVELARNFNHIVNSSDQERQAENAGKAENALSNGSGCNESIDPPATSNGSARNGSASTRSASNGSASPKLAGNGSARNGSASTRSASNGSASPKLAGNGSARNGSASTRLASPTSASNGSTSNGSASTRSASPTSASPISTSNESASNGATSSKSASPISTSNEATSNGSTINRSASPKSAGPISTSNGSASNGSASPISTSNGSAKNGSTSVDSILDKIKNNKQVNI